MEKFVRFICQFFKAKNKNVSTHLSLKTKEVNLEIFCFSCYQNVKIYKKNSLLNFKFSIFNFSCIFGSLFRRHNLRKTLFLLCVAIMCCYNVIEAAKIPDDMIAVKSCGRDLTNRMGRICALRGGYRTSTSGRVRVRRGIVNDCCAKACTDKSLYGYCQNSNSDLEIQTVAPYEQLTTTTTTTTSPTMDPNIVAKIQRHRGRVEFGTIAPEYNIKPITRFRRH